MLQTQNGNNNGYCQDNDTSWFDWGRVESQGELLHFVQRLIAFRKRHAALRRRRFLTGGAVPGRGLPDVAWHGTRLHEPEWDDPESRFLAYTLVAPNGSQADLHIVFNMSKAASEIELPNIPGRAWHRALDTATEPPQELLDREQQTPWEEPRYPVQPRSVVVLEGWPC